MTRTELVSLIKAKKSFLCVGLDTDLNKIPEHLLQTEDPVFEFNKQIIDHTLDFTIAYKPNLAFYEAMGIKGLVSLKKTIDYLHNFKKQIFTIADAKRGDIGNTSQQYAKAFLDPQGEFDFDSITIAPYMGDDSVTPFMAYENKWVILLVLTSNKGAFDFQFMQDAQTGEKLFEKVLKASFQWGDPENMMYVVGATKAEMLAEIRTIAPNSFLLVPGVGAQGGSLQEVCKYGFSQDCGLLINSSRGIIYASREKDFAEKARQEAFKMQQEMEMIMKERGMI